MRGTTAMTESQRPHDAQDDVICTPQKQTATIGVIVAAGGKEMIEGITSLLRRA
ncbi:MAG TPA: hypothetical protein VM659_08095 [Dongiaceae bacterium]|nr:hypothetical protein [Dongiaceae bacterium]